MGEEKLLERNRKLIAKLRDVEEENRRLKRQIDGYVKEFRVCRFCAEVHSDCSPTDSKSCFPRWRGL